MIDVCCAILKDGAEFLAVQRGRSGAQALKWEFPGGKINPGETPEDCIRREIVEELGVKISIVKQLESIIFDYKSQRICLIPFICRIISGEITLNEHEAKVWFELGKWETIDWSEADAELIRKNYQELSANEY